MAEKASWEDTDLKKMKEEPREYVGQKFLLEMWVQEARVWQVGLEAIVARAEWEEKEVVGAKIQKKKVDQVITGLISLYEELAYRLLLWAVKRTTGVFEQRNDWGVKFILWPAWLRHTVK